MIRSCPAVGAPPTPGCGSRSLSLGIFGNIVYADRYGPRSGVIRDVAANLLVLGCSAAIRGQYRNRFSRQIPRCSPERTNGSAANQNPAVRPIESTWLRSAMQPITACCRVLEVLGRRMRALGPRVSESVDLKSAVRPSLSLCNVVVRNGLQSLSEWLKRSPDG